MYNFPIGYICDLNSPALGKMLDMAVHLNMQGVQLVAPVGGKAPSDMKGERLRDVLDMFASRGLKISALCGDIGAYTDAEANKERIPEFKKLLDLAADLGTNIVTTHIGRVPDDKNDPTYAVLQAACGEIGAYAANIGAYFAVETGPELSTVLKEFLDSLHTKGAGVNLDPANLTMCICDNAVEAVYNLKDYIVHTHAKDGRNLQKRTVDHDYAYVETPLGQGDVNFPKYLQALDNIGYRGFLIIEREICNPEQDIALAAGFLRGTIGALTRK